MISPPGCKDCLCDGRGGDLGLRVVFQKLLGSKGYKWILSCSSRSEEAA